LLNQAVRDQEDNELQRVKEELKEVSANEKESRDHMQAMSQQIDERDEIIQ
jgi:hypothetical protein